MGVYFGRFKRFEWLGEKWYNKIKKVIYMLREIIEKTIQEIKEEGGAYDIEIFCIEAIWKWYIIEYDEKPYVANFSDMDEEITEELIEENLKNLKRLEEYEFLMKDGKREMFLRDVGLRNGMKKNNGFCNMLGWGYKKQGEGRYVLPNEKFFALHILFLQNSDFISLFNIKNKKELSVQLKNEKSVIRYGRLLDKCKDGVSYGYIYEALTGVNLALLFMNYYVIYVQHLKRILKNTHPMCAVGVGEDFRFERLPKSEEQRYINNIQMEKVKENLKYYLFSVLKEVLDIPFAYARIFWADKKLCDIYKEMIEFKYIDQIWSGDGIKVVADNCENGLGGSIKEFQRRQSRDIEIYERIYAKFSKKIEDVYQITKEVEQVPDKIWKEIRQWLNINKIEDEERKVKENSRMPIVFIKTGLQRGNWEGEWAEVSHFLVDTLDIIRNQTNK